MKVLGIETSCDECAAAVVEDGRKILSNRVATQIDWHRQYNGVVPEIASRIHTEWIRPVVREALQEAGLKKEDIDAVAVTNRPGLIGSLLVGVNFAKSFAYALGIPFVGVDHIRAHIYAAHLEREIPYPYIGLLVSGGNTILCEVRSFDDIIIRGATIDDAVGEAFDKVAKFYGFGYPGGVAVDRLAAKGDADAFVFPSPRLYKGNHPYDVSYSGLKNAVINQRLQFLRPGSADTPENIAASFQKRAVDILLKKLFRLCDDTGINRIVAGGGVAANSLLRKRVAEQKKREVIFPSLSLCGDNAAMVAGIGYHYLKRGDRDGLRLSASPRVDGFRKIIRKKVLFRINNSRRSFMAKFGKSDEFRYEIIRTLGEIPGDRKWKIRLNLISWNGSEPKYDIRPWSEDGNSMGKGISMSKEELLGLKKILDSVDW